MDFPILTTERCLLRDISHDDAEHVWTASRHPGFTDGMLWDPPESIEEIHTFAEETMEKNQRGESYTWTITEKDTDEFIGRIALRPEEEKNVWNIGFWLHPTKWGKGFMTEAAREVLKYGFSREDMRKIVAAHASWNETSKKVMERLQMRHVRHNPVGFMKHGKAVPEEEYEMTKEEWEKLSSN